MALKRAVKVLTSSAFLGAAIAIVFDRVQALDHLKSAHSLSQAYLDFSVDASGGLPLGAVTARFGEHEEAPFKIERIQGQGELVESGGHPQDVLYFRTTSPQETLEESYTFVFTDFESVVEPFFVNARRSDKLEGFGTNLSLSAPHNNSAGNTFYEYTVDGSEQPLKAIHGRLRTEPYNYQPGHTYRVDSLVDYRTQLVSTRVYDAALGPSAYDQTIKVVKYKSRIYPGIMNPSGGTIVVTSFAYGPAGDVARRPHIASRAFDYLNYLGFNAGTRGPEDAPASRALEQYFPALGIKHVRVPAEQGFLPSVNALAKFGIDADVLTSNKSTIPSLKQFVKGLARPPDSIELWNEPNNPSEGAAYSADFADVLPQFARDVRTSFPGTKVWGPSILPDQNGYPTVAKRLAPLIGSSINAWNTHSYTIATPENTGYGGFVSGACGATMREDCGWYGAANWNDNVSAVVNSSLPGVITEGAASYGSYPEICGHTNVSLQVQQAYLQRGMLYNFKLGHLRIYPYKFIDDGKCSDGFGTFGIISRITQADGSILFTPKPSYTALAYLNRLLRDDAANASEFKAKALTYALSGATPDIEELLLAHADGSYRLVLWSDASLWDFNANGVYRVGAALPETVEHVTVKFGSAVIAQCFNQVAMSGQWVPGPRSEGATQIAASVSQFPMVVEISPVSIASTATHRVEIQQDVATPGPVETPGAKRQP